jgi:hypothetical protein
MQRARRFVSATLLAAILPVAPALAEPNRSLTGLRADDRPPETIPLPFPAPEWLHTNLHIHRDAGLEYRRSLSWGEHDYTFSLLGPVIHEKRLDFGLAFQLRF